MAKVRTNIEIEDAYVRAIMDRYGVRTKTAAVDLALRHMAGQPMSRDEALAMHGAHAIGQAPADDSPLTYIGPMTTEEILAMEGSGWEGDLGAMRRIDRSLEEWIAEQDEPASPHS